MASELKNKPKNIGDIIFKKVGRHVPFEELDSLIQIDILKYIRRYGLGYKAFGIKGFDIIRNIFFAYEYALDNDYFHGINGQRLEFKSFEEFINYIGSEIYNSSCYYGYKFSEDEIKKYGLDVSSLNFDSFIKYDVDDYTFEKMLENEKYQNEQKNILNNEVKKWLSNLEEIKSLEEFSRLYDYFSKKFIKLDSKKFFSLMHLKFGDKIAQFVAIYLCIRDIDCGINFTDILIRYGNEWGNYVIQNFKGAWSNATAKGRIRSFKFTYENYYSGSYHHEQRCGFEKASQLYYVDDIMIDENRMGYHTRQYLFTFDELIKKTKGDISWSDFSEAPISTDEILKYHVSERTKLPIKKNFSTYTIKKYYHNASFKVEQKWFDDSSVLVFQKEHTFNYFFDFAHFLKNDLSNADLLMCEGIENIRDINNLNLIDAHFKSNVSRILGLKLNKVLLNDCDLITFEKTSKCELATVCEYEIEHPCIEDFNKEISYITDIHIIHRFFANHFESFDDLDYLIRTITSKINNSNTEINLIGGDIASDFRHFELFVSYLNKRHNKNFIALGNHELWNREGQQLQEIINEYKELSKLYNFYLVHNNAYILTWNGVEEITTDQLVNFSVDDLRKKARDAYLIIFGGIGFSGFNSGFNADDGIYRGALTREQEISESEFFSSLYNKILDSFFDKNVIVLTHMPMKDWRRVEKFQKGFVYVSGHNHHNFYFDDRVKRIYSDNQIGYKLKEINLKKFSINYEYNWFADFKDGIYEISRNDYEKFYRGIGQCLTFNRDFACLYMLKRQDTYMFIMKGSKETLYILNGGAIKKAGNHNLQYFYDNLVNYSESIRLFLKDFIEFQKEISKQIKNIGGSGTLHGSIVDIDFYNHLFINPIDKKITPYFAYTMTEKYVYKNLLSLLKFQCPALYANYLKMIESNDKNGFDLVKKEKSNEITQKNIYVPDTSMYRISRLLNGLQFTVNYKVVRLWNDTIVSDCSIESGKMIVNEIINPNENSFKN